MQSIPLYTEGYIYALICIPNVYVFSIIYASRRASENISQKVPAVALGELPVTDQSYIHKYAPE